MLDPSSWEVESDDHLRPGVWDEFGKYSETQGMNEWVNLGLTFYKVPTVKNCC